MSEASLLTLRKFKWRILGIYVLVTLLGLAGMTYALAGLNGFEVGLLFLGAVTTAIGLIFAAVTCWIGFGEVYRHAKTHGYYLVTEECTLQASGERALDGVRLVRYRSLKDGRVWARPSAEFHDGRFEEVP